MSPQGQLIIGYEGFQSFCCFWFAWGSIYILKKMYFGTLVCFTGIMWELRSRSRRSWFESRVRGLEGNSYVENVEFLKVMN